MDQIDIGVLALVMIATAAWIGLLVWLWRDCRKEKDHVGADRNAVRRDRAAGR